MEILRRKLYEAEANFTINCTSITYCYVYCGSCVYDSSPPASSPAADASANHNNHAIPYLVSAAGVLGVAFLLLTTCTILVRHRWSRRRTSVRVASTSRGSDEDHSSVDHPIWHIVTVGLPQSVIDSITAVSYKSCCDWLIEGSDCSVCLTRFEEGDDVRLLPKCSHAFHLPCIDTWLRSHKNCPLCRAPVVNDSSPVTLNPDSSNSSPPGSARIESSENPRERADDDDDTSPIEAARTDEGSYLGENLRVVNEDFQPVRRSISLDSSAAFAVNKSVVIDVGLQNGEGSSKKEKIAEEADKEGNGDSSISRMMKRSLSSSAKILSPFRGSKSQSSSSTLPL